MISILQTIWNQENGQDLIEYTLLISFVTLATAGLFVLGASGNIAGIWVKGNEQIAAANAAAS